MGLHTFSWLYIQAKFSFMWIKMKVTLVHQCEFAAGCHEDGVQVWYWTGSHDVSPHSLKTQQHTNSLLLHVIVWDLTFNTVYWIWAVYFLKTSWTAMCMNHWHTQGVLPILSYWIRFIKSSCTFAGNSHHVSAPELSTGSVCPQWEGLLSLAPLITLLYTPHWGCVFPGNFTALALPKGNLGTWRESSNWWILGSLEIKR